jgi:hypothetical protein
MQVAGGGAWRSGDSGLTVREVSLPSPPMSRRLTLPNSTRCAIVDDDVFERVRHLKWRLTRDGYVVSGASAAVIWLHRLVAGTKPGLDTDHANGRREDNRRANLRSCTRSLNNANARWRRPSKTGYRGVYATPNGRFRAQIRVRRRLLQLGTFARAADAARSYDVAARLHFAEFASCNFSPDGRRRLRQRARAGADHAPRRRA